MAILISFIPVHDTQIGYQSGRFYVTMLADFDWIKNNQMHINQILNRRGETRNDSLKIDQLFEDELSQILISHKGKFLFRENKPCHYNLQQLKAIDPVFGSTEKDDTDQIARIYLGEYQDIHYFLIQIPKLYDELESLQLIDLRSAALSSELFDIGALFYSQGLINWHFNHTFCAKCGSRSKMVHSGHSRICENPNCQKEHFPRIEPAVIFSIQTKVDGLSKILLARQANWPAKRYSVVAGFAEHGETLEHAVQREALEEVGINVTNVKYVASQPWPFPASLMIGFTCETKEQNIRLVDQELEHAEWFSAEEIKNASEKGDLLMPFSVSISWHLVDQWYREQTGESLTSIDKPYTN